MSANENTEKTPLEHIGENKVKLTLLIEAARFEEGLNHAYMKNRGKINLPGFRRGRAPRKMVEMHFGKDIFHEEAIEFVFPAAYDAAIEEHKLKVVSRPDVDFKGIEDGFAILEVEIYTKPIAKIDDYTGLEYKQPIVEVKDEEIDNEVESDRKKNVRITAVTDRPVETGDTVIIDFEGFVDGAPFESGKAENFELEIGSKSFIDTFEDQIIGKNIGEKFEVNVTFPGDYHAEHLAGMAAVFKIKLHEILHKELPEADDDFAQEVSEFDTLEEYKADIKAKILEHKENAAARNIEEQLLLALAKRVDVAVPQPMIDFEVEHMMRGFANRLRNQGINPGHYMAMTGTTPDSLRAMYQLQAIATIKGQLAIEAIILNEGVEISEEEFDQEIARTAETHNTSVEEVLEKVGADETEAIKADLKAKKVLALVKEAAVVVEQVALEDIADDSGEGFDDDDYDDDFEDAEE